MSLEPERKNHGSNDNNKNRDNLTKSGGTKISYIDKVGIHSTIDSARHLERAQEKEPVVTEGNQKGSWQIKQTDDNGNDNNYAWG